MQNRALPAEEGAASLASTVLDLITTYAVPYWDRYSTLDDLVKHFAAGDPVLCRGDWHWKLCGGVCPTWETGRGGRVSSRGWSGQASGETARRVKAAIIRACRRNTRNDAHVRGPRERPTRRSLSYLHAAAVRRFFTTTGRTRSLTTTPKTDGDCARSPHIGRSVASRTLPQPSALNTYSTATRRVDWR